MNVIKRILSLIAAAVIAVGLFAAVPEVAYAAGSIYSLSALNGGSVLDPDNNPVAVGAKIPNGSILNATDFHSCDIYIDGVCVDTLYKPGHVQYTLTQDLCLAEADGSGTSGHFYFTSVAPSQNDDDAPAASGHKKVKAAQPEHTHNYVYTVITAPTEDINGEAADICSCGDSKNHVVLPQIDVIMTNRLTQISQAKAGQTITLKMGMTNNLPKWFMAKIAEKNDVNFKIQIQYEHQNYEISIPRGTAVDLNEEWYGPEKLMSLYATQRMN